MDENSIIVKIPMDRYDELFEQWIHDNKLYIDNHIFNKRTNQFDSYLGLKLSADKIDDSSDLMFTIVDGKKFTIAQLKYMF
jgi:hypothetical protein